MANPGKRAPIFSSENRQFRIFFFPALRSFPKISRRGGEGMAFCVAKKTERWHLFYGVVLALWGLVLAPGKSLAAGFALYEFGARGNALGGTLVGRADDASAVYFNPAGITQLEGEWIMAGVTAISPSAKIEAVDWGTGKNRDKTFWPPHMYYTKQISDTQWWGVGIFTRFGLGTDFDPDWFGRYNHYKTEITSLSLNPVYAWKLNEALSVAFGVEAMWFEYDTRKKLDWAAIASGTAPDPSTHMADIDSHLLGDSWGYGVNLALHWRPTEKSRFGVSWRSSVKQSLKGDITFQKPTLPDPYTIPDGFFENTGARGDVTLPDTLSLGWAYQVSDRLSVEIGGVWTKWSTYDALIINYDNPLVPINPDSKSTYAPKHWEDAWRYAIGVEYALSDTWDIRLGYVYDQSPIPDAYVDYIVPTDSRKIYCLGFGWKGERWNVDFSYMYLDMEDRYVAGDPAAGIYSSRLTDGDTQLIGLSVSWHF
jgi:long-chain fatty acid transport protein